MMVYTSKGFLINKKYDSKEIHHYTQVIGKEEYAKLLKDLEKIADHKQTR
jgi:hypothetical protein